MQAREAAPIPEQEAAATLEGVHEVEAGVWRDRGRCATEAYRGKQALLDERCRKRSQSPSTPHPVNLDPQHLHQATKRSQRDRRAPISTRDMRACKECHLEKPDSAFARDTKYTRDLAPVCLACSRAQAARSGASLARQRTPSAVQEAAPISSPVLDTAAAAELLLQLGAGQPKGRASGSQRAAEATVQARPSHAAAPSAGTPPALRFGDAGPGPSAGSHSEFSLLELLGKRLVRVGVWGV